jgi:transcriptional regulator NrdR family protein
MQCPNCGFDKTRVMDSRHMDGMTRRRRKCCLCKESFTTCELVVPDKYMRAADTTSQAVENLCRDLPGQMEATRLQAAGLEVPHGPDQN